MDYHVLKITWVICSYNLQGRITCISEKSQRKTLEDERTIVTRIKTRFEPMKNKLTYTEKNNNYCSIGVQDTIENKNFGIQDSTVKQRNGC